MTMSPIGPFSVSIKSGLAISVGIGVLILIKSISTACPAWTENDGFSIVVPDKMAVVKLVPSTGSKTELSIASSINSEKIWVDCMG